MIEIQPYKSIWEGCCFQRDVLGVVRTKLQLRAVWLCGDQQCCVLLCDLAFSNMDFYLVPLTPREEIFSSEKNSEYLGKWVWLKSWGIML